MEIDEFSILSVKRQISTKNDPNKPSLVIEAGKEPIILYSFQLKNQSEYSLKNIYLEQEICQAFINEQYSGEDQMEVFEKSEDQEKKRIISIKINEIEPNGSKNFAIRFKLLKDADFAKDLYCGKAEITYYVEDYNFKYDFDKVQIIVPMETGLKIYQLEEQPEKSEVSLFFTNPSNITLKMSEFKIVDRVEGKTLYQSPDSRVIFPLTRQISYIEPLKIPLKNKDIYQTGSEFSFTPIHSQKFFLLKNVKTLANKSIGLPEVTIEFAHSRETIFFGKTKEFSSQITIENIGNTDFDEFIIECTLPDGYVIGNLENLEIFKEEMSLKDIPQCEITSEGNSLKIHYTNTDYESNADLDFDIDEDLGIKLPIVCEEWDYDTNFKVSMKARFIKRGESNIEIERNSESGEIEIIKPEINLEVSKHYNLSEKPGVFAVAIEVKNSGNYPIENRKIYSEIAQGWHLSRVSRKNTRPSCLTT